MKCLGCSFVSELNLYFSDGLSPTPCDTKLLFNTLGCISFWEVVLLWMFCGEMDCFPHREQLRFIRESDLVLGAPRAVLV